MQRRKQMQPSQNHVMHFVKVVQPLHHVMYSDIQLIDQMQVVQSCVQFHNVSEKMLQNK